MHDTGYRELGGTCTAVMPTPPPSNSMIDCGPNGTFNGRACSCDEGYTQTGLGEARTCEAIPACRGADDDYEPNSVPSQAATFDVDRANLYACPADDDWFIFDVEAGDRVSVEISFDGAAVDLDLLVFDPTSEDPVGWSFSSDSSREAADFVARAAGIAGILVTPYGLGEGAYQIDVDIQAGEPPMCASPGASCRSGPDCCSGNCHIGHCH